MLKKVQNLWNFIIKKKKTNNLTNLYSIKNNFLFSNAISSSLTFFISTLKNIKIKRISLVNKITSHIQPYFITYFISLTVWFSLVFYLFFIF